MLDFGGDARHERIYRAMRSAVGKGGSAVDEANAIESLWRFVRAKAIAEAVELMERAALEAFPDKATWLLPYYERLLLLFAEPDATDDERRAAVTELYTLQIASDIPDLVASLTTLDARFSVTATDPLQSCSTVPGRAFDDYAAAEPFIADDESASPSGRRSTAFPNYSSELTLVTVLELGDGVLPTDAERRTMAKAKRLLGELLPGHNDLVMVTHRGFTLDVSRLDLTGLGA
jgi:hypothetical protein